MKQTYINPTVNVVKIQTSNIIASSPTLEIKNEDATGAGMSREFDYDDEEEYEEY